MGAAAARRCRCRDPSPRGIAAVTVARGSGAMCHTAGLLPGAADADTHGKLRAARKDAKGTAVLHEVGPPRA